MGTNAEREQGVMGKKNREVRVRVNTQEVERNTPKLSLVFSLTLLSCSSRFLLALQQSTVKLSLLLIFKYFVRH